jgi:hypothetical protein
MSQLAKTSDHLDGCGLERRKVHLLCLDQSWHDRYTIASRLLGTRMERPGNRRVSRSRFGMRDSAYRAAHLRSRSQTGNRHEVSLSIDAAACEHLE